MRYFEKQPKFWVVGSVIPIRSCITIIAWGFVGFFVLSFGGCTRSSTINSIVETLPPAPAFQLDSVPEPPLFESKFVVLTHSRYLFYNLAKEIAAYHEAPLIFINENTFDQITAKLKYVDPEYAIVVLPPFLITPDLVGSLFKCFCSLNGDVYPDVQFGYITGYTIDDARSLFYRDQQDTAALDKFLGVSHLYPGGEWVKSYLSNFADRFRASGWYGDTAIMDMESGADNVAGELKKFATNQVIFFIGHGGPDNICDISGCDLANVDLTGDVVLSGACSTGATYGDGAPGDSEYIALRILKQGACVYESRVVLNGWGSWPAVSVLDGSGTWGEAVNDGIKAEMQQFNEDTLNILSWQQVSQEYPTGNFPFINETARIIPFGDPSFKPRLKSPVFITLP